MTAPPEGHDELREYQRLVARLDYPMYIVTTVAADDGERSGCLVGFASQCSIKPPRHAVWISNKNHTSGVVRRAEWVALHALDPANRDLAELFGGETGDTIDKFERCEWRPGPGGLPILVGTAGWFAGRIVVALPATGDHDGYVVEPVQASRPPEPLEPRAGFQALKSIDPGHAP